MSKLPYTEMEKRAKSTKTGYYYATLEFDKFAKLQKIPSLQNLTVDVLTADPPLGAEAILGQFSMYMLTDGKNRKDEGFKVGTLLQYLSGVKTVLAKKFPGTFRDADDEWYSELYSSLDMRGRVMCIRSGKPVSEKNNADAQGCVSVGWKLFVQGKYS